MKTQYNTQFTGWLIRGEGEEAAAAAAAAAGKKVEFSPEQQAELNRILADEKRKHQANTQKAIDELELLRTKADMTEKDRNELDARMQTLRDTLKTREEQEREARQKLERDYKKQLEETSAAAKNWEQKYTTSTIRTALVTEAAAVNAYDPGQILAIIGPDTSLEEKLDSEGKPTGELVPVVTWRDEKDGQPITLKLSPKEAVKRMSESDRFLNLFKGKGSGGAGGGSGRPAGPLSQNDIRNLIRTNPEEYRRLRKEGKIKLT
jgi:hypothetical protein